MTNTNQNIPLTPGQQKILITIKDELLPKVDKLKNLLVDIQTYRVSYKLYSRKLSVFEKKYSEVSKGFFEIAKKLETPDILFDGVEGGDENMVGYFQFRN